MSMKSQLYYNAAEAIYCIMPPNDPRIKSEKGWKLWSVEDEPTFESEGTDDDEDEDGFEADLRRQEEYMNDDNWEYED